MNTLLARHHDVTGGATVESSLAWLLAPLSVETFFDTVWGAAPYHVRRGRTGYFDRLLPAASAAEDLLEHARREPSAVRLVRDGDDSEPLAGGALDLARVRAGLADGYTVVLDTLERYVRAIGALAHSLEVELNFPAQVNAYITPAGSTGFVPHYDHHDVLILQIQGSKTWHLYHDAAVAPHRVQRRDDVDPAALPAPSDLHLAAGDTLYLPRGQIHAAETRAEASVHLTVGIHTPTVLTLLTHALHALSVREDRLHTRLPPRYLDDTDARASLGALVHDAARTVEDPGAVADGLGALEDLLVRRGRCPPVGQAGQAVGIDAHTRVVKYQPLYSRVTAAAGGVALQFAQLLISAGPDHEAALRFVSAGTEPFRVGDLPGLATAQQIALARSLITSGFLTRVHDGADDPA